MTDDDSFVAGWLRYDPRPGAQTVTDRLQSLTARVAEQAAEITRLKAANEELVGALAGMVQAVDVLAAHYKIDQDAETAAHPDGAYSRARQVLSLHRQQGEKGEP